MRRILFVLGLVPNKVGGVEVLCREFAQQAGELGWQVVYCFEGPPSPQAKHYLQLDNVVLDALPAQKGFSATVSWQLHRLFRRHEPEVVVYAFDGALRSLPWVAKMSGIRSVFYNDRTSRRDAVPPAKSALKRAMARALTHPLNGVVTVSDFVRQQSLAEGYVTAPHHVVHNGVRAQPLDEATSRQRGAAFRARHGISSSTKLVVQVGWLVPEKGVEVFLHAAAQLARKLPDVHFALVGDGSHLERYRRMGQQLGLEGRLTWTGTVASPVEDGAFAAADVSCQLSLWAEAFGFTVVEAMSLGVPVVASRIGGIPEVVEDGASGFLVQPGDADETAARLLQLLGDDALREAFGRAAKARAQQHFDVRRTAAAYCQAFGLARAPAVARLAGPLAEPIEPARLLPQQSD